MGKGSPGYYKRLETFKNNPEIEERRKNKLKGHIAWNKGKTAETDLRIKKISDSLFEYYKTHDGKQKGKPRTDEEKRKISETLKGNKNGLDNRSTKGYIHIYKDGVNTTVPKETLDDYLNKGWKIGNLHKYRIEYNAIGVHNITDDIYYKSISEARRLSGISDYYIKLSIKNNHEYKGKLFEYSDNKNSSLQ